ncbi:GNAT family N-acetyltransferase [Bacillus carboniphilus]|uniref:GNAT family N-acetyltransferase n=2 Tax=Bacillati TaxID=1783272 RepID=A0ABN0WQD2_9BACI
MEPILLSVPTQIETDRLTLRAPSEGDGRVVNVAIRESLNELKPWLSFAQSMPAVEETEANIRKALVQFLERKSFRFLIFHKENQEFIGTASIHGIDWRIPKGEIGYWVSTPYSGKGYMTEAIQAITNFGFEELKLNRIQIQIESTNEKSQAIPRKLGYNLEGILKNDDLSADGSRLTDTCIFALTR